MKPVAEGALAERRWEYDAPSFDPPDLHVVPPSEEDAELAAANQEFTFIRGGFQYIRDLEEKYGHVPPEVAPGVYGEHHLEYIRLGDMLALTQLRGEANPEFRNIADSLMPNLDGRNRNLQNLPDMVFIDPNLFERYVQFTNKIWGKEDSADKYPHVNGVYQLTAAGHTRRSGMIDREIALSEKAKELGYETDWRDSVVLVKVYRVTEPKQILKIQMTENLHSKQSQERTAQGMVEMYLWGLEIGEWENPLQFKQELKGQFTDRAIDDAVAFSDLPPSVRDQVFKKRLRYGAAIALARVIPAYREYNLFCNYDDRTYDELNDDEQNKFDDEVVEWTRTEVSRIQRERLNITAAVTAYEGYIGNWEETVGRPLRVVEAEPEVKIVHRKPTNVNQIGMFPEEDSVAERSDAEHKEYMNRLVSQRTGQLKRLASSSVENAMTVFAHLDELGLPPEEMAKIREMAGKIADVVKAGLWDHQKDHVLNFDE